MTFDTSSTRFEMFTQACALFVLFVIFWNCHGIDIIDLDVVKDKKDCKAVGDL
jgi:hypothetical protein